MSDYSLAMEKAVLYDLAAVQGAVPTYEKVQEDRAKAADEAAAAEAKALAAEAAPAAPAPKSAASSTATTSGGTSSASR